MKSKILIALQLLFLIVAMSATGGCVVGNPFGHCGLAYRHLSEIWLSVRLRCHNHLGSGSVL